MTQQTDRHNWTIPSDGETNWDQPLNSFFDDELDEEVPYTISSGTATLSGGSSPALNTLLTNVSTNQTVNICSVDIAVDSDPAFNADYGFNHDWSQYWDDTNSEVDVELTVNWDTDPGNGNDVTIAYAVKAREL